MDKSVSYKVVLDGKVQPNEDRDEVIDSLCELFQSQPSTIERLLLGQEVFLKKNYPLDEAESICSAIQSTGAGCRIVPVERSDLESSDEDGEDLQNSDFGDVDSDSGIVNVNVNISVENNISGDVTDNSSDEFDGGLKEEELHQTGSSFHHKTARPPSASEKIASFVGPNMEYYSQQFSRMGTVQNPRFRPSWHWPAFFAFFFWAAYRKMWLWAGLHVIGGILLMNFFPPSSLWIIYSLAWPVAANALYYRHYCHYHQQAEIFETAEDRLSFLSRKGGVSRNAFWIALAASLGISIYSSNMMINDLVERYEEQFGPITGDDALLEQTRGDGSLLGPAGDPDSPLARTSLLLSTLAKGLKVVIATGSEEMFHETLNRLTDKLGEEDVVDAWGHPILLERELEHVVLTAPGPDGQPKTDDDVQHRINY